MNPSQCWRNKQIRQETETFKHVVRKKRHSLDEIRRNNVQLSGELCLRDIEIAALQQDESLNVRISCIISAW